METLREQEILKSIARMTSEGQYDMKALEPRAESLPTMLVRHGLLPTWMFLRSKGQGAGGETERAVCALLLAGIRGAVAPMGIESLTTLHKPLADRECDFDSDLAKVTLLEYLLLQEVAVETAAILARWVKVQP